MSIKKIGNWFGPALIIAGLAGFVTAQQDKPEAKKENPLYIFTIDQEVKRTPVKNQARTGTCWDFATISFLESELLRTGKGEFDLSEMYVARQTYPLKATNYVRRHGDATFGSGGQSHDVIDRLRDCGIVPESAYPGMNIDEPRHDHGELAVLLRGMLDGVVKGRKLTPRWLDAFDAVLDVYLGHPPEQFTYQDKTYSPQSFLHDLLQLNLDDYIEITSFSHHPFYQQFLLEIPDNWCYNNRYYNVPVSDLEAIMDYSLKNGYSFVWDGDVSEREFSQNKSGYAYVPAKDWEYKTTAEQEAKLTEPEPEKEVTQPARQKMFDNFATTDDHLMHIVGLAHDQKGTKFYLTKNSGGTDRKYEGYVYMSRAYTLLKSTAIMVNKHALPLDIAAKMGLK